MKLSLAVILLLFSVALFGQPGSYNPARSYPADSLKADLRFLRQKLEVMHPGLYRYATRAELTGLFDSLARVIRQPMDEQQFLSLLMLVQARIRNGHTLFLPGGDAMSYFRARERFLPIQVRWIDGRLFVRQDWSADSSIGQGSEVIRVNGIGSAEVWRQLMARQVRDGYNETYPEWILDQYFYSNFSFVYGESSEFKLELRRGKRETVIKQVRALTRDSIAYFRQLRYGRSDDAGRGMILRESGTFRGAVLTIRSFDPGMLLSQYRQDFKKVTDSIFMQMQLHGDSVLILDLRDNQGGDFVMPRYILGHLVSAPTLFLVSGPESKLIRPAKDHFSGRLIVLVNGGSFSATAILASTFERDRRAVFVGEETGGNATIISGDPEEVVLPHTGISCSVSTKIYRIRDRINTGHGVMPAYRVLPASGDLITGRDRAMEMAEQLARRRP